MDLNEYEKTCVVSKQTCAFSCLCVSHTSEHFQHLLTFCNIEERFIGNYFQICTRFHRHLFTLHIFLIYIKTREDNLIFTNDINRDNSRLNV
jgi:hypothetical protein